MNRPERFSNLPEYAFPRLRALLDHLPAGGDVIHMSIGEPKHPMPEQVQETLAQNMHLFGKYPDNHGTPALRSSIATWVKNRFHAQIDPDTQILALNGTREGLFAAILATVPETKSSNRPNVLMPNPFYQVYAVGTAAAGATPVFVPATAENGFLPDYASLDEKALNDTSVLFLCSPSNPQGAVATKPYLAKLLKLAEKHNFRIFADECYSEIYRNAPPPGLLQVAHEIGADPDRVLVFHSLSKRSNVPGLRSGFAAGSANCIAEMKQLRAYAGAPLPEPIQAVSSALWADETHVIQNRALYREKYALSDQIMERVPNYTPIEAGFFIWLNVGDSEDTTKYLWQKGGLRVLPGKYLSRATDGTDPGAAFIRIAMVAALPEYRRGLTTLATLLEERAK